jgi:hypothetical protein
MQPRPSLTLRKPTTVSPDAVAAFVAASDGDHESTPSASGSVAPALRAVAAMEPVAAAEPAAPGHTRRADVPSFRRASRAVIERRTRPARRRTTVYLDVDVAAELARALAQRDQELSDAVNGAIRTWLDAIK